MLKTRSFTEFNANREFCGCACVFFFVFVCVCVCVCV